MTKRFYIETSDEFGPLEADAFDTPEAAMKYGADLVSDGWRYAVVVDRNEMLPIATYGNPPADWL
jgi:hypothetical protein